MEKQYYEYKQILQDSLEPLGFDAQPENTVGLGRSLTLVKDGFQVQLVYDLRDQLVTLQASNQDRKLAGRSYFYSAESIKKDFFIKLNEILAPQGIKVEVSAVAAKSGGFLSKLFGKK